MMFLRLSNVFEDVLPEETIKYEYILLSGGEIMPHVELSESFSGDVIIESRLHSSLAIMELCLATNALRRLGIKRIELVMPYIPYARQDKVAYLGQPLSIVVFADIINSMNYDKVHVLDPHSPVSMALINNSFDFDQSGIYKELIRGATNYCLVSPDAGAEKRTHKIAAILGVNDMVFCSKTRESKTGSIVGIKVHAHDLNGKDCYIVDDICAGGRTFFEIATELRKLNCGKIFLYVSHGIFCNGTEQLRTVIDKIYTTNLFEYNETADVEMLPLRKENLK